MNPRVQRWSACSRRKYAELHTGLTLLRMYGHVNPVSLMGFYIPEGVRVLRVVEEIREKGAAPFRDNDGK